MKLEKTFVALVTLLFLCAVVFPHAGAFAVTGKHVVAISPGENMGEITVTNSGDKILIVQLSTTEEQYYTSEDASFISSENWEEKFKQYDWQRVNWVNEIKYGEVIIVPQKKEIIRYNIIVPENITKGTFYAKLEVKDIGEKEGMVIIRPVYVSQVVAHISQRHQTAGLGFFISLLIIICVSILLIKCKNDK